MVLDLVFKHCKMSCKKEKRLQSKKRKLEVLLELFEKDDPAEKVILSELH